MLLTSCTCYATLKDVIEKSMNKPFAFKFGQGPQVVSDSAFARPTSAKKAAAADSALPALDYDGPSLPLDVVRKVRAHFAPKDPTKTVWF